MDGMCDLPAEVLEEGWQRPIEAAAGGDWDVVVAGAGPAGSMAALHLARYGRRVLLLDRARVPRDKACGDGLIADALRALDRAGLGRRIRELGHRVRVAQVVSPSGISFDIPADYVMCPRRVLDAVVAREAVRSGAVFCGRAEVADARAERGGVRVRIAGSGREVTARVLVVATGATVRLPARLGLIRRRRPTAFGVRCYVRSRWGPDHIVGVYLRQILPGYGWIFPLGNGLYNTGVVVFPSHRPGRLNNVREAFGLFARCCGPAREMIGAAEEVGPLRGAMLRCGLRGTRLAGPTNVVAAGEAAGTTLPLLGEGIGKAMETGELAARVIHETLTDGDGRGLAEYARRVGREFRPLYRGYRFGERCIGRAWLNDYMSRRVGRSPLLRELLAGLISGTRDPREVFSVGAVVRSFWR